MLLLGQYALLEALRPLDNLVVKPNHRFIFEAQFVIEI
jgi:hypothetical protein